MRLRRVAKKISIEWRRGFVVVLPLLLSLLSIGLCFSNSINQQSILFLTENEALMRDSHSSKGQSPTIDDKVPSTTQDMGNLHIVFLGDSVMRYQYLSLVYYIHYGKWEENRKWPTTACKTNSWSWFFNYTTTLFHNKESCDCFRMDGAPDPEHIFENRYYIDQGKNVSISYFQKLGDGPFHGHWDPDRFPKRLHQFVHQPATWHETSWHGMIVNYISRLTPRPNFVVFNAGRWRRHGLDKSAFASVYRALHALDMVGIYKTTTTGRKDADPGRVQKHDQIGCSMSHYCLNMSWTRDLDHSSYCDDTHFLPDGNRRSNELLLDLIRGVKSMKLSTA